MHRDTIMDGAMFYLSKPAKPEIDEFLAQAARDNYSYPEVGATRAALPPGYWKYDDNSVVVGSGDLVWARAKQALREWKMFDLGWAGICWPDTPLEEGRNVAMMASHLGFYSLNAARIVYTLDEENRFGFAYGTLTSHAECGEEIFSVERSSQTDEIIYRLYSFSRPNHLTARIGYPYARYLQRLFIEHSKQRMCQAVSASI